MDIQKAARKRLTAARLIWAFWLANILFTIVLWWIGNKAGLLSGELGHVLIGLAFLFGMLGTVGILTQFVLMGRTSWLEPIFGLDRLSQFHRLNGEVSLIVILLHPILMVLGYVVLGGLDPISQYLLLVADPYVLFASIALALLVFTVCLSIYIVRKHLRFETWYAVHLLNYAVVALVIWHQIEGGSGVQYWYWIALYAFALGNIVIWRWIKPFAQSTYYKFAVQKVVAETPTATSVYISGRHLERFKAKGGQFVMVRFLSKKLRWQEHPFSLSRLPAGDGIRLTIRQLGDFTNEMPTLKPGTKVIVSGPHGAFTHDKQVTDRVLYIVGGIGITPIRAMIQERATWAKPGKAALIYGNRTVADTALLGELTELGAKIAMPIYNVLSEQKDHKGETGYVDCEKISRLVPDFVKRDIFLCGPPPMMTSIIAELKKRGMPARQIHYERFSLHSS